MNLDFSEILLAVVKQKASDLHITAGSPPMLRIRGSLVAMEGMLQLMGEQFGLPRAEALALARGTTSEGKVLFAVRS